MDTAAIASLAMNMQSAKLQQQVSMCVMKKSLDVTQQQAQALTDMLKTNTQVMERSVNPHMGARLDVLG